MANSPYTHKALILAAGVGSRLAPITKDIPKSLVPVNGMPIILNQIRCLMGNNVREITVVTGYKADILRRTVARDFPDVRFIHNDSFETTNNMVSAFLARASMSQTPFLMMNADVFFDPSVIRGLLDFQFPNAVVTQLDAYNQESMKVTSDGHFLNSISKDITPQEALGTSIDVYKFSAEAAQLFFRTCEQYIVDQNKGNLWAEVAINAIFRLTRFKACPISGRWYEIDTIQDLKNAELLFN